LASLMRGLVWAQANDNGWRTFGGKYVEYPRFRKQWWAYRQTYHGHVRDELVCHSLKEKSLASSVRMVVNDIEDLREAWGTLDTCFDRPEKYIAEALEPIVKFRGYKAFNSSAVREFYSLLRAAMMGAKKATLLHRLVNDQMLPSILAKMPPTIGGSGQKRDPPGCGERLRRPFGPCRPEMEGCAEVTAAEPAGWNTGSSGAGGHGMDRRGLMEAAKKLSHAAIHVAAAEEKPPQAEGSDKRCIFADILRCPEHAPWKCRAFGNIRVEERARIIEDNRLCAFCLLCSTKGQLRAGRRRAGPSQRAASPSVRAGTPCGCTSS
jgi:hypothetical protein